MKDFYGVIVKSGELVIHQSSSGDIIKSRVDTITEEELTVYNPYEDKFYELDNRDVFLLKG